MYLEYRYYTVVCRKTLVIKRDKVGVCVVYRGVPFGVYTDEMCTMCRYDRSVQNDEAAF